MRSTLLFSLFLALPGAASAQKHEVGLTLGSLLPRDLVQGARLSGGTALQANYGYRVANFGLAAVYAEVHFLGNAQRTVDHAGPQATRDVATIYLTPGVRVKLLPKSPVAPYFAVGGGYAAYQQSRLQADGAANPARRDLNRGTFDYGAGVDVKFWRWIGLRGEIRDFYTGAPGYNLTGVAGGQHNVVVGGGFVIRLGS